MKRHGFLIVLLFLIAAEITAVAIFAVWDPDIRQDAVLVNEAVQSVEEEWDTIEDYKDHTGLDYVVLDENGSVRFGTRRGLSESVNMAVIHRDTILDLRVADRVVGKIIFDNNGLQILRTQKRRILSVLLMVMVIQCCICTGYMIYLERVIVKPFHKLKGFAERVAGGNLDIPLHMDRQNLFGAFTESFDLMRSELKKARAAEAQANTSKKELVAKLSHDIKTPVASIKAAAEVGAALMDKGAAADSGRIRENYGQIIRKADQINALITNLFTATLEELRQLSVTPKAVESKVLKEILENADYLHRAEIPVIPECMLYADELRLQQVFDNIFANSYKYAGTKIDLSVYRSEHSAAVSIEDYGGGVKEEEVPLLKEKFKRGSHGKEVEGAGLGLYISDYFMREMGGELDIRNGENGLKVTVRIKDSLRSV